MSVFRCEGPCGGLYGAVGFAKNRVLYAYNTARRRPMCKLCEQTARDKIKQANRARVKARDCFRRHADRFCTQGLANDRPAFADRFGWRIDRMVHDLEHTYDNWCQCGAKFKEMGHGLSDITLDICDPRLLPYYSSNTRWICSTCNRKKARTPPEEWGAQIVYEQQWRAQMARITTDPLAGLPLFDNAPSLLLG